MNDKSISSGVEMSKIRELPEFERTISAGLIAAKEAVLAPMRPTLREHNITEPQWRVMRVINDRGAADATAIAEVGLLHGPSVTRILKELDARKLVVRQIDPDDRRRTVAELTPSGRDLITVISSDVVRVMGEYSERFGNERMDHLIMELRALTAAINGVE